MDQIRDMVPGGHWGFGGDLIRKAAPEVGNLIGAQCQIPYYPDLIHFTNGVTRGHHNKYLQPATRTDVYKYSFFPSAIKLWNTLPEELIDAKTIDEFKNLLSYL